MTTFAELITDVTTLTNRPDLVTETKLAIRAATLKAHHQDFFVQDLYEIGVTFLTSEYQQTILYKDLVPLWRAFKYLRKCDNNKVPEHFLELITPDSVLDSYSIHKEDVCYVAGLELKTRTIDQRDKFLLGCYVHPKILETDYDSWIADEYPLAIIYEAAALIFKTVGFDEMVSTYRSMVAEEYTELTRNCIVANGY